jgi:ribose transport system permease protein
MIELAGMLPVLIVICILFAVLTPNFLTQNNMVNVVRQASINIVLAAGMTFVILTGGIDLAVGSVLGFTAVIAVAVSLIPGLGWAAVPAALFAGLLIGVLTGATVAYIGLPPFIVTLGTYTAIRGAAYLAAGGTTVINSKIGFAWIGNGYLGPVPWLVVIALLIIALSAFILHRTILGVHIYADFCLWRQRTSVGTGWCHEREPSVQRSRPIRHRLRVGCHRRGDPGRHQFRRRNWNCLWNVDRSSDHRGAE